MPNVSFILNGLCSQVVILNIQLSTIFNLFLCYFQELPQFYTFNCLDFNESSEFLADEVDLPMDVTPRSTHGNHAAFKKQISKDSSPIKSATNK